MKKIFISFILLIGFLFSGCGQFNKTIIFDKIDFYKDEITDEEYYFSYPLGAEVVDDSYFVYEGCKVYFGMVVPMISNEDVYDIRNYKENGVSYRALYMDNVLEYYYASPEVEDILYTFVAFDEEIGVSQCTELVNFVAESFTKDPAYYNDQFGFKIDILPDYKMEDLPSGEGILMKKNVDKEICKDEKTGEEFPCNPYFIEISVFASNNIMKYKDVSDFVSKKYEGYSIEFLDNNGINGIYVDEGNGKEAIRHFFMMSKDKEILYEALLKVPSVYYTKHKEEFDALVRSIRI